MEQAVHNFIASNFYDGRNFVPKMNTENGEVSDQTLFEYHQKETMLWADYSGGDVIKGHLIGTVSENGQLDFYYHHMNTQNQLRVGRCHSIPNLLENGKIELNETWQWLNGDKSNGASILSEQ